MILKNILGKYNKLSAPVKASIWFLICSIIIKCFSMISTPIFTRILTVEEYGHTANFYSWYDLMYPFFTLYLSGVAYNNVLIKYEGDRARATVSLMTLVSLIVFIFFVIYLLLNNTLNSLFDISTPMMCVMFLNFLSYPILDFWSAKERFDYKYRKLVLISITISILGILLGILGVLFTNYKYESRVSSPIFVTFIVSIFLFFITFKDANFKNTTKYWKYALIISIPLIPHYLSIKILNQVDRVMITKLVGIQETGLYSLAYTVASLMVFVTDAINRSMCPFVYKKIKENNIKPIRNMTSIVLLLVMFVTFIEMLVAPELIRVFATKEYLEAIYIIPPVALSVYFTFLYVIFANVEFYFEKTIFATVVSIIGAVCNIILNLIFIPILGYLAAGYTTLICYILFTFLHYLNFKTIIKKRIELNKIFNLKHILYISAIGILLMIISLYVYKYTCIRLLLILILLVTGILYKKRISKLINRITD